MMDDGSREKAVEKKEGDDRESRHVYVGNHVPLFLKVAWGLLILWILYYLYTYALPAYLHWPGKK